MTVPDVPPKIELSGVRKAFGSKVVLDGLDLFGARPRQVLLYALLDAINASDVQAAVVGCSSRYDALDLGEKRVRSRFSGRRFLLTPAGGGAMAGRAAAGGARPTAEGVGGLRESAPSHESPGSPFSAHSHGP